MADLKLLTERVVEKEKAAIRDRIEAAKVKAEDDIQAFKAKEVAREQQLREEISLKSQSEYTIKKNTLEIDKRNQLLGAKQVILDKVFKDVKNQLNQIDQTAFQSFAKAVLNQFEEGSQLTLVLGEKTAGFIDQAWVNTQAPQAMTVELSNETVSNQAGLIVEKDGIDYNFLFNSLVEDIKPDLLSDISKDLF